MSDNQRASAKAKTFFVFWYGFMVIWWVALHMLALTDTTANYLYGGVFGLIPVIGGLVGLRRAKQWGLFRSAMGKACLFLSLGLITWGIGNQIWAYFNLTQAIEVPYPSTADIAYIVSWPLWALGVISLSRATGARVSLRKMQGKIQLLVIPILIAALSYYVLVVVARQGVLVASDSTLKAFFDVAYPVGDIVILTLAALVFGLSYKHLGGRFRAPVLCILFGFFLNYVGDATFVWTVTKGTFTTGNWVDLIYTSAMTMLVLGVVALDPRAALKDTTT
ncbi:MAG: hypothetical protein AAB865_02075 [Patescibacteria group bacterium]